MNATNRQRGIAGLLLAALGLLHGPAAAADHTALDVILSATVRGERVDYGVILGEHLDALDEYLDRMAEVDASKLTGEEQLAYFINVYNATLLRVVAPNWKEGYSPADDGFVVFDEPLVRLRGRQVSLNHVEHEIVRKTFGDARIHAALVCAAVSCPPLLPRAYDASDLDEVMQANMRRFVRDSTRNQVDDASRTLRLSAIFDWYAEDFGGRESLGDYVSRYLGRDVTGYAVYFLPYDWTLNAARTHE